MQTSYTVMYIISLKIVSFCHTIIHVYSCGGRGGFTGSFFESTEQKESLALTLNKVDEYIVVPYKMQTKELHLFNKSEGYINKPLWNFQNRLYQLRSQKHPHRSTVNISVELVVLSYLFNNIYSNFLLHAQKSDIKTNSMQSLLHIGSKFRELFSTCFKLLPEKRRNIYCKLFKINGHDTQSHIFKFTGHKMFGLHLILNVIDILYSLNCEIDRIEIYNYYNRRVSMFCGKHPLNHINSFHHKFHINTTYKSLNYFVVKGVTQITERNKIDSVYCSYMGLI